MNCPMNFKMNPPMKNKLPKKNLMIATMMNNIKIATTNPKRIPTMLNIKLIIFYIILFCSDII